MTTNKVIRLSKVLKELNVSLDRAVACLHNKEIYIEAKATTKISKSSYNILLENFEKDAQKKVAVKKLITSINR